MTSSLRIAVAALAISVVASACGAGSGEGHAPGHLAVQAAVRRGACVPVHPRTSPYRGLLVLARSDGRRVRVEAGSRGHGRTSLASGRYRLVPPLSGSTVHVQIDGRAVSVSGRAYPLRIGAGRTVRLAVVILPRRGDCTSGGASG